MTKTLPLNSRRGFCWRLAVLPLAFLLLGPAVAETPPDAPRTIVLVRHGERITPDGDVALSAKGRERAKALSYMIADLDLHAIYTSQMIRTIETAAPVAAATGVKSELIPVEKTDVLVEKLKQLPPGRSALVVNHSGTIPTIVEKLGAGKVPPVSEDEFDRFLIVTIPATGTPSVVTLRYGGR
jgi:broad specificity phosphatase PhoE